MSRRVAALMTGAMLASAAGPVSAHDCPECSDAASTSFWTSDWNLGWYAGAGYQGSRFEDWSLASRVDSGTFTSRSEDDADAGLRLVAGMEFLTYFSVEAAYTDFGEATFSGQSDGTGAIFAAGPQRDSVELDGYALHLGARVPVGMDFWVAGKAGWWLYHARQRATGTVHNPPPAGPPAPYALDESDNGIRFSWGAGLDYDGFKPFRISAEYRAATFRAPLTEDSFGSSEASSVGLSVTYCF